MRLLFLSPLASCKWEVHGIGNVHSTVQALSPQAQLGRKCYSTRPRVWAMPTCCVRVSLLPLSGCVAGRDASWTCPGNFKSRPFMETVYGNRHGRTVKRHAPPARPSRDCYVHVQRPRDSHTKYSIVLTLTISRIAPPPPQFREISRARPSRPPPNTGKHFVYKTEILVYSRTSRNYVKYKYRYSTTRTVHPETCTKNRNSKHLVRARRSLRPSLKPELPDVCHT